MFKIRSDNAISLSIRTQIGVDIYMSENMTLHIASVKVITVFKTHVQFNLDMYVKVNENLLHLNKV